MITGGQLVNATAINHGHFLTALQSIKYPNSPYISTNLYYDQFETLFAEKKMVYRNLTEMIGEAVTRIFDNKSYVSSQGATFANIMQWATLSDGYYYPNISYKGIAAAAGAASHFVLMVSLAFITSNMTVKTLANASTRRKLALASSILNPSS